MFSSLDSTDTGAELDEALATIEAAQVALTVAAVGWLSTGAWRADGARSAVSWLVAQRGVHPGDAARLLRRARLVQRMDLAEVLIAGTMSTAQADLLAGAIGRDPALLAVAREQRDWFLEQCKLGHLDDFARVVKVWRAYALDHVDATHRDRYDRRGLHLSENLFGDLDLDGHVPLEDADVVKDAIATYSRPDPIGIERSPAQRRQDALTDALRAALGHTGPDAVVDGGEPGDPDATPTASAGSRGRGEPTVIIDHRFWDDDSAGPEVGATFQSHPVRRDTAARLSCDCVPAHVWADPLTRRLRYGAARRDPTPAQRRTVIVRDRHCRFPGCRIPHAECQVHHLVPVSHRGPTDLDNLVLVCRWHHRLVHEGGWTLRGSAGQELVARGPTGRLVHDPG